MKKIVLVLCFVFIALFGLTSCGKDESGGDDAGGNTGSTVYVKFWIHKAKSEEEGTIYQKIADDFNKAGNKTSDGKIVKIKLEFQNSASNLATKITTAAATGGLPDVVAVDSPMITNYAKQNILTDISSYISDSIKDSYVDSVISQGTVDGKLYALSAMEAPTGLYYNKALLAQVGITGFGTIENPWSWKDVMDALKKLKANDKTASSAQIKLNRGFGGDEGPMYLYSALAYSAGGNIYQNGTVKNALNSQETINGLKQLEQFFAKGSDWEYKGSNEYALVVGDCAFEIHGSWNIRKFDEKYASKASDYGVMPFPVYEENGQKGTVVSGCGSWGFGVTTACKNKEAASIALTYFTGKDASKLLADSIGIFPTNKEVLAEEKYQTGNLGMMNSLLQNCAVTRPMLKEYNVLRDSYAKIINYVASYGSLANYNLETYIAEQITNLNL